MFLETLNVPPRDRAGLVRSTVGISSVTRRKIHIVQMSGLGHGGGHEGTEIQMSGSGRGGGHEGTEKQERKIPSAAEVDGVHIRRECCVWEPGLYLFSACATCTYNKVVVLEKPPHVPSPFRKSHRQTQLCVHRRDEGFGGGSVERCTPVSPYIPALSSCSSLKVSV